MDYQQIIDRIQKQFPGTVLNLGEEQEQFINLDPGDWLDVAMFLRDEEDLKFDSLACITGVDPGVDEELEVRYNLHSMVHKHKIEILIRLPRKRPNVPSIEQVWRIGDWFEREVFDMYGIRFKGHRDLRRMLLPEDWKGWPLRKDYAMPELYHGIIVPKVKEEWE
jgi:NADH-quinone oxidoreductase subunit C